jgi:hypothetical protein
MISNGALNCHADLRIVKKIPHIYIRTNDMNLANSVDKAWRGNLRSRQVLVLILLLSKNTEKSGREKGVTA